MYSELVSPQALYYQREPVMTFIAADPKNFKTSRTFYEWP